MSKRVLLLFQDCIYCAPYGKWIGRQEKLAKAHGIEIIQTPFTAPGAKELILEGDKKGFEALPFFTDGKGKFSRNIVNFVESTESLADKPVKRKKTTKKLKDKADEVVPEA